MFGDSVTKKLIYGELFAGCNDDVRSTVPARTRMKISLVKVRILDHFSTSRAIHVGVSASQGSQARIIQFVSGKKLEAS